MGISITTTGDWEPTRSYLKRVQNAQVDAILNKYGQVGVAALAAATPVDSSETAHGWYYKVISRKGYSSLRFYNSHIENGTPIVILLQYGHGTKNGGYVQGRDFIMPAIQPIFDQIAEEAWKEVTQ
jgi:hypothetical protein